MSGTSRISTRVSIRLPNEVVRTLQHRVDGTRSRWLTISEYIKEMVIFHVERKHVKRNSLTTLQELKARNDE